jgi:serine/threonine protein kinase
MKMLDHPSIVKLYEILESDEEIFIVMEYVVGKDLNDWPAKHRKSPTFMDDVC